MMIPEMMDAIAECELEMELIEADHREPEAPELADAELAEIDWDY